MDRCLVVLAIAACSRRPPIASCDDDLRGVYAVDGQRWMVLDHGATLEAYPLFPDIDAPTESRGSSSASGPELIAAPRVIDLERTGEPARPAALSGTVHRRYMLRAERCDATAPAHVTRCTGDALELVVSEPAPPIGFAPCRWPGVAPSRVVHWRRE